MRKSRVLIFVWSVVLGVCLNSALSSAIAEEGCQEWVARVVSVEGTVHVQHKGQKEWRTVRLDDTFCPGDVLVVRPNSRAALILPNEATFRLDENTRLTFLPAEQQTTSFIDLLVGAVHFFSRAKRSLQVNTPYVNAAVEGTEFLVEVKEGETFISLFEGKILASNQSGRITLTKGQSALAKAGMAPTLQLVAHPQKAVHWTLYYPPIVEFRPSDFGSGDDWQPQVRKSIEFYWQGDIAAALSALQGVPADIRDPRFYDYRAALLLSVGRAEEAQKNIGQALAIDKRDARALALKSIIALAQNDNTGALEIAQEAVESDKRSSTAKVALAYAQQAHFNLQGARKSLQQAVDLNPDNSLAWATLAEIWLSLGYLDRALQAADTAARLNPHLARAQTVLGFAHLIQINIREAKEAFAQAIKLAQADPMPRLGLGLAEIRSGDLRAGRRDIEAALSLDPNNSLIRSYLGKAFYEEKREKLASRELGIAKELDPRDPTPWLYDAILKQSVNRPVEALHDLQKSIELNDNRAIYRSRLMLDEDTATKSANLARIYDDLGFEQAGLVEGWKSLQHDPANYSAHRFLADTYANLPRQQIASLSELLQAQLLQPISVNPIQPNLDYLRTGVFGSSSNTIFQETGPTDPSFNEYTPLFVQNGPHFQANGLGGSNDTFGDVVAQSGLWDKFSYNIGQLHYQTDGFRENNDLDQDFYNAFTQINLSYKSSIQAEFRHTDTDKGDLALRFDPEDYYATLRQDEHTNSGRLGFHYAFAPGSDLIASAMYGEGSFGTHFDGYELSTTENGFLGETQYLYRSERFNLTGGFGQFYAERKDEAYFTFDENMGTTEPVVDKSDLYHTNFYTYSLINFPDKVTWTLGGSADFFKAVTERNQFNPKLGVSWNPFPSTTLRAAVFRALKRTLISSQTIEPTQVAGFNQFFDDPEGTDSWRYGIGLDLKLRDNLYGGIEFSRRDLDVPYRTITLETESTDWDENMGRLYLYWIINRWLTATAGFQYEKYERNEDNVGVEMFTELETYRVPLGINFYHPSGFIAQLQTTYVDQSGKFGDPGYTLAPGADHFWVFDASIGYRLPNRWGVLTLEVKNLFDESFQFQDTDPLSPSISPDRVIFGKFTIGF